MWGVKRCIAKYLPLPPNHQISFDNKNYAKNKHWIRKQHSVFYNNALSPSLTKTTIPNINTV